TWRAPARSRRTSSHRRRRAPPGERCTWRSRTSRRSSCRTSTWRTTCSSRARWDSERGHAPPGPGARRNPSGGADLPMKRDERLRDLSDDHHSALVLARRARNAGAYAHSVKQGEVWGAVASAFAQDLAPHFAIEEQLLLPA